MTTTVDPTRPYLPYNLRGLRDLLVIAIRDGDKTLEHEIRHKIWTLTDNPNHYD